MGGGSANTWAATTNTNWATTSGGSNNASVPGTSDVAIFDGNSGTGNAVIGASITVQGLDCTGGTGSYAGTITHNASVTLTINTGAASSIRFSAGMTYTAASLTSLITLTHTSGTANITCAGQKLAALTINGAGGTTQTLDALLVNAVQSAALTVTSGIFDANGGAGGPWPITAIVFSFTGSTTRSVILGGTVTVGGNIANQTQCLYATTTTLLTFTKNSANIIILTPTSAVQQIVFAGGGLTYNDLTANLSTTQTTLSFPDSCTLAHLVNSGGWNVMITSNKTVTISNPFTWVGTQATPIVIQSTGLLPVILSCPSGSCTLQWGGLVGVTGSGGATFTATNTLNFGINSGWSITPPADATVVAPTAAQIASAVWKDTTAGDFTVASSVGLSVMNGVALGTGLTINGLTANGATNLGKTTSAIGRGTVTTGASTTSIPTSAFTPAGAVANQFAGRVVLFDGDTTTTALRGQAAVISASSNASTPTFTVAALTSTPAAGDSFSVI